MAAWAIIQNLTNILLIQRSNKTTRAGQWCLPGGGIKNDETPEQACIREVKEETQLSILPIDNVLDTRGDYYFLCKLENPLEPITLKENECCNYAWVEPINLTNIGIIMNLKAIVPLLRSLGYSVNLTSDLEQYIAECLPFYH